MREGEERRRDGKEMRNKGHDDDCYKGEGRRGGLFKERWRVGEVRKEGEERMRDGREMRNIGTDYDCYKGEGRIA